MRTLFRKNEIKLLVLILFVAFLVRLYRISNPVLDWHAFRQADTASVTREYVKHGIDPLRPTYLDVSSLQSGLDNPNGYRMVEFPLINIILASLLRVFPQLSLELVSRLFSVFFSLIGITALYGLVRSISGKKVAMAAAVMFSLLPYNVYYSRVVLPEPVLVSTVLLSAYSFQQWLKRGKLTWYAASFFFLLTSYLLKPYTIFFTPIFAALAYERFSWKMFLKPSLWLFAIVTPLPMFWWRSWIAQFPEGIPANSWLLNGNDIRFKPSWFKWIFFERLHRLISGTAGSIFLAANVLQLTREELVVYGSWWAGMLAYVTIFATGNVQHDYYQALLIPIVAISLGRGAVILFNHLHLLKTTSLSMVFFASWLFFILAYSTTFVFNWQLSGFFPAFIARETVLFVFLSTLTTALLLWKKQGNVVNKRLACGAVILIFGSSLVCSWQYVGGYFNVNHWEYVRVGKAVQAATSPDALVIAPNMGDSQLLFQTDRRGWSLGGAIDDKIAKGADYYVGMNRDDETNELLRRFSLVTESPEFVIIDLHKPKSASNSAESVQ